MHTSLSKKLLAGLLSLVMVLSLVAPSTSAQAATKYSLTDKKSVKSGVTFKYQLKGVSKGCYVKVTRNVSGEKVVYNKKALTKTTKINGTGKTLNLYVTYGEKDENYTGKFTVKVYGKKTNKLYKTLVETVTVKVPEKEDPQPEDPQPEEPVEPETTLAITSVTAKKVNVLEVAFASAVDTADVTLAVTRGNTSVPAASVEWNADKTVATITTAAKMISGTHTVTATSASTEKTATGTVEIEAQKVAKIVIDSTVALTGATVSGSAMKAYAYYDVLDQYGESLRTSTSIEWSSSCGTPTVNKSTGKLTFTRSDNKAFTYNEQIFVTGVYTKTGVSVTETLTVGAEQALNSIELQGFVKKGTTDLVQSLPAGFKAGEYLLVYSVLDQNGNAMDPASDNISENRVTFVSDNIMVVKAIDTDGDVVTLNGVQYCTAVVTPGIKVADGGEFNVTAIANKTGNKVNLNVVVGEDAVVTSFTMSAPEDLIADGEVVEIPFVALDQNGNEITNFVTLAKQETFNKLSFSVSESGATLKLKQNNDGTASLLYYDKTVYWSNSISTDGIDRTVSLTSVIVGGDSCNIMISIADKARPDAIAGVKLGSVLLEGATIDLTSIGKYSFYDQYGRLMRRTVDRTYYMDYYTRWGADNGFFEAAKAGALNGTEFKNYSYGIKITYSGNNGVYDGGSPVANDTEFIYSAASENNTIAALTTATNVATSKSGEGFKFEIARQKSGSTDWETTSASKYQALTIVDIAQVKNIAIVELNKFFYETDNSGNEKLIGSLTANSTTTGLENDEDYQQEVKVTGTYNGTKLYIPTQYYTVGSEYLTTTSGTAIGANVINAASGTSILDDNKLYSQIGTAANFARKDLTDKLVVNVYEFYATSGTALQTVGSSAVGKPLNTVSTKITISDAAPEAAAIYADDVTLNSTQTVLDNDTIVTENLNRYYYWYDEFCYTDFTVFDQYGVFYNDVKFKISNIEENAAGYAQNNFKVTNNTTKAIAVDGAELGDTFDLTIEAGDLAKTVKVTVGYDYNACITQSGNTYLDTLVNGVAGLEVQRVAGLQ